MRDRGALARQLDKLESQLGLISKHDLARTKKALLAKKEMELKVGSTSAVMT